MRTIRPFALHLEPETESRPMRVTVCVAGMSPDEGAVLRMTPDCMTLDALESCIDALRHELDLLRSRAQRAFDCIGDRA